MNPAFKDHLPQTDYERYQKLCHDRWLLGSYTDFPFVQDERDYITGEIQKIEAVVTLTRIQCA